MEKTTLLSLKEILEASPLVHRVEGNGTCLKIITDILLGVSYDYLNLYLSEEEGEFFLQDANNIYAVMDDFYELNEERLKNAAAKAGLDFADYRYSKTVDNQSVIEAMKGFAIVVESLEAYL